MSHHGTATSHRREERTTTQLGTDTGALHAVVTRYTVTGRAGDHANG
jgi:hypothetical protein